MSDYEKQQSPMMSGGAKRKIRLSGEHMNLQPSAPISGQKIKKIIRRLPLQEVSHSSV